MEIKRTGPNELAWPTPESGKAAAPNAAKTQAGGAGPEVSGMDAAFAPIQADYKRADLHSDKWPAILRQSADALVSQSSRQFGSLPAVDQRKIADLIASDPIFSDKIFRFLDKRLV